MELIDRYIKEIGKHLPQKNRADIEFEIHSTLEDMLDDRSQKAGRPVDEAMTVDMLKGTAGLRKLLPPMHPSAT